MIERPLSVEEICNKLRPIFGKKIDQVYFRYSVAEDREEKEEIGHILNALYQKNLHQLLDKGVLLEPPQEEMIDGNYTFATVSYAKRKLFPFKLREHDWPRHICITGMSGSGKTTLGFHILDSLIKKQKPFLVFDWKKSFRPLLSVDSSVMNFTVGDDRVSNLFKTNINRPPKNVPPKEWINVLCDLLTESFSASFGVHKVLLETLDEAFKEWGIYSGSENYPTWNHIKWRLEEKLGSTKGQSREGGWIESALRIATVLTFGDFGKTLNYKGDRAVSVEDLLDKRVIMELNSLGSVEKKFFCEFVLTYIYKYKKATQNFASHSFDHAILVDEAHNIFLKQPTNFSSESVTDMIYREMREYGTSLICLDQHVSKISDTVKGNSACHIAFQQQLPQDIWDISDLMQLREKKHYFSQLPVGHAIVKLSERYTQPFLIEVAKADVRENNVSDDDIRSRMQAIFMGQDFESEVDPEFNESVQNPEPVAVAPVAQTISNENPQEVVYSEPVVIPQENPQMDCDIALTPVQDILYDYIKEHLAAGVELEAVEKILEKSKDQGGYTSQDILTVINEAFRNQLVVTFKNNASPDVAGLTPDQQIFMEFLRGNPDHGLSTVEVYRAVGLSARKGTKTKNELQEMGLIGIEEVKYDKGWKKLIRLNQ